MNLQTITDNWPIVSGLIVAIIAFAFHIGGKYEERTEDVGFGKWLTTKENVKYVMYSLGLGILGTVMKSELMEPLGFSKPLTYTFVVWYGGMHLVSRILGMKSASKARKA